MACFNKILGPNGLIKNHMMNFLVRHKLLNHLKFSTWIFKSGVRLNKYVMFLEEITKWIDKGSPVNVFLDLQKAECHIKDYHLN